MMQGPAQQQQQRQIGFAPGGAMPPEQQPMSAPMPMPMLQFLHMQEPQLPQTGGGPSLSFGKQYYEQAMPLG